MDNQHVSPALMARLLMGRATPEEIQQVVVPHLVSLCPGCNEIYQDLVRTGRRVRNLRVELRPEQVVLLGRAASFHVKQLAQHGVRELLPDVRLENTIIVDGPHDSPAPHAAHGST